MGRNFPARLPLRKSKQTRFCWHFSSWRATAAPPTLRTRITELWSRPNPPQQRDAHPWLQIWKKNKLFKDIIQASLKIHIQHTEEDRYCNHRMPVIGCRRLKHQQPDQREFKRSPDCVPQKSRKTPVKGYAEAKILTTSFQSCET